jgi:hypothetical protein
MFSVLRAFLGLSVGVLAGFMGKLISERGFKPIWVTVILLIFYVIGVLVCASGCRKN